MSGYRCPIDVSIKPLRSLRLKITDRCPWNCWFCHNEGTGKRDPSRTKDIYWDSEFEQVLVELKSVLSLNEVHLTGGEPTTNPNIANLITGIKFHGLDVKATTIGCSYSVLKPILDAGISGLNFSLHSIDSDELLKTQVDRKIEWMRKQLKQQMQAILIAKENSVKVKINTVILLNSFEQPTPPPFS